MLQYLIKLSISLAVLYIFYRAVLRPLTFYQCNRFYLLCYSLLSWVIPFINIAPWLATDSKKGIIQFIPALTTYNKAEMPVQGAAQGWLQHFTGTDWLLLVFCLGMLAMLVKLVIQFISLHRIRQKAMLFEGGNGVQLYETNAVVSPFSFGNAIYFNRRLHSEEELQRIIQHEFVHVKQKHTIDLLTAELLCVVNWFNPFAWAIRYCIRQNLEFIADNKVIANGIDKKEYQYLLLKVTGVPQYSITGYFNFSNLKKRIAMMNKMKTARLHLTKFLFIVPLLVVMLLAFRSKMEQGSTNDDKKVQIAGLVVDVTTLQPIAGAAVYCKEKNVTAVTDNNGYYFLELPYDNKPLQFSLSAEKEGYNVCRSVENWGNFYQENVRTRYSKSVEFFGLDKSEQPGNGYAALTGNAPANATLNYDFVRSALDEFKQRMKNSTASNYDTVPPPPPPPLFPPVEDAPPQPPVRKSFNNKGYHISVADNNGECIVLVTDKKQVIVKATSLVEWNKNKSVNESRYGKIPPPPPPPPPLNAPEKDEPAEPVVIAAPEKVATPAEIPEAPEAPEIIITDGIKKINIERSPVKKDRIGIVTVIPDGGIKEVYNFDIPKERAAYIKKYGGLPESLPPVKAAPVIQSSPSIQPSPSIKPAPAIKPAPVSIRSAVVGGNKSPLIVVDNVVMPVNFNVNNVPSKKIRVMQVLKGKTAYLKYGDAGSNGVVEISTNGWYVPGVDSVTIIKDHPVYPEK